MSALPGSDAMTTGPLLCMYHQLEPALLIGDWTCRSLYMNFPHEKPRAYSGVDCRAVRDAAEVLRRSPDAARVLLERQTAPGHPLPGFFTVESPGYCIRFNAYPSARGRHLWAMVLRQ